MYYNDFKNIIEKVLMENISGRLLMDLIIDTFDCELIYDSQDILLTDIYFTLKHYASGEEMIGKQEWEYFMECLDGRRIYNILEKMSITTKSIKD